MNLLSDDVISLLADLVRIPSVCGEEGRVAQFIAKWFMKNGLPVEIRANLISIGIWILKEADAVRLGKSKTCSGISELCAIVRDGLL